MFCLQKRPTSFEPVHGWSYSFEIFSYELKLVYMNYEGIQRFSHS